MDFQDGPVRDTLGEYKIGQYFKLYERVRRQIDARAEKGHQARVDIGNKIVEVSPNYENKNIEPGTAAGAVITALQFTLESYIPFAGDTEITSVQETEDGAIYQVNVDSFLRQEGRFKAIMESGQGFTSLVTDEFEFEGDPDVFNKKPARSTWQYTVKVKTQEDIDKEVMGLGILTE